MDAMKIANSIPMWIACGIPVILVIAQALIFAKKSYSAGKKIGLTEKQMKNAIKSSAITSIGPSIVILQCTPERWKKYRAFTALFESGRKNLTFPWTRIDDFQGKRWYNIYCVKKRQKGRCLCQRNRRQR